MAGAAPVVRRHEALTAGTTVDLTSIVESTTLVDDQGDVGDAWTFAYIREPVEPRRPVVFLFNGGPGCSSVWLHLSGLGPWRARVPQDVRADPVVDVDLLEPSRHSLLDVADLVFLDPIGTGFARLADDVDVGRASGLERDCALTAQAIASWLVRHDRMGSPVHLLGESYGTIRAATTAARMLADDGPVVSGIAMLGQCLNAQETTQRPGNPIGYIAGLPFLAATAWFHGRGAHQDSALEDVVRAAHDFAVGDYAAALVGGPSRSAGDVVARLAGFTGLGEDALCARRLRVDKEEFRSLLLADAGRVVGLTDTRYTIAAAPPGSHEPIVDAAAVRIDPVFAAARRALFEDVLDVRAPGAYHLAVPAHERWDYQEGTAAHLFGGSTLPSPFATFDYARNLSAVLRANPGARLFFGTGHFDALTTVGSLEHLLAQYGLPATRITEGRYPAGHMMYTDEASLAALACDLRRFLRS